MSEESTVTQGFNDAELEDIMQEIESLESECVGRKGKEQEKKEDKQEALNEEFQKYQEEFQQEFSSSPVANVKEVRPVGPKRSEKLQQTIDNEVNSLYKKEDSPQKSPMAAAASNSLSFELQGQLAMNLKIKGKNESIRLFIDEQNVFVVEFPNGAKVQFPLS
jgi:hypothetical protein